MSNRPHPIYNWPMFIGVITTFLICMAMMIYDVAHAASPWMPEGQEVKPIGGWVRFCQSYPAECKIDVSEPVAFKLTSENLKTIKLINVAVNGGILEVPDEPGPENDIWTLAENGTGDCEDIQLLKRHLLAQRGIPHRAMRMTVVIDEKGEGHAVLTLHTDRGDFILDNKTDTVKPWFDTGYVFTKRENGDGIWVSTR